jgi:hypothetical protein
VIGAVPGSTIAATGSCGHVWSVTYRRAREVVDNETPIACGVCRRQGPASFEFAGRRCEVDGCANRLAERNPGPECFACQEAVRLADLLAVAA